MSQADTPISELSPDTKLTFLVDEENIQKFEQSFGKQFLSAKFIPLPRNIKQNKFNEYEKNILKELNSCHLLISTIISIDDANIIDYLRLNCENEVKNKLIILLHQNPSVLPSAILSRATILGNFSNDPYSFYSDIEVLEGRLVPKGISNLTVDVGNGTFNKASNNPLLLDVAQGFNKIIFFTTKLEKEFWDKIKILEKENEVLRKKNRFDFLCSMEMRSLFSTIFIVTGLFFLLISMKKVLQKASPAQKKIIQKSFFPKWYFATHYWQVCYKNKFTLVLSLLGFFIIIFGIGLLPNCAEIGKLISKLKDFI